MCPCSILPVVRRHFKGARGNPNPARYPLCRRAHKHFRKSRRRGRTNPQRCTELLRRAYSCGCCTQRPPSLGSYSRGVTFVTIQSQLSASVKSRTMSANQRWETELFAMQVMVQGREQKYRLKKHTRIPLLVENATESCSSV